MKLLFIAAFLLHLVGGGQLLVHDATGFAIIERDSAMYHVFIDRFGLPVGAVPSILISGAYYLDDNKVM